MELCTNIFVADYSQYYDIIKAIRVEVFVKEQGVPANLEMDDRDEYCQHFLARRGRECIGTARIDFALDGKVGRLAVLLPYRFEGIGSTIMHNIYATAKSRDLNKIWCNAQINAQSFYEKLGYKASGASFLEAGIEHVTMTCRIPL